MKGIPMQLPNLGDPATWPSVITSVAMIRALALLIVGWLLARVAGAAIHGLLVRTSQVSYATLARRIASTLVFGIAVATALQELGFDLTLFVGAAGLLTVALGFASQTSASNVISGLFLLTEGSIAVGDLIKLGNTLGHVVAIDLLSVRIRTRENLIVRIPNESLVKGEITNLTRLAIRRALIPLRIPYKEDLRRARQVLLDAADGYEKALRDPEPFVMVQGFSEGRRRRRALGLAPLRRFPRDEDRDAHPREGSARPCHGRDDPTPGRAARGRARREADRSPTRGLISDPRTPCAASRCRPSSS
jgi:small-conductance mechanosensitive channel